MPTFDFKGTGIFAPVNNNEAAIALFEEYDIPYHLVTKGENEGKIRVKKPLDWDLEQYDELKDMLEICGYADIMDHPVIFRDVDDEPIFCFSTCMPREGIGADGKSIHKELKVPTYECEIRDPGIHDYGTVTIVFRRSW